MYIVHSTLSSVYNLHCTVYSVKCKLTCTKFICTMYIVHSTISSVYNLHCRVYSVKCKLYTELSVLCTMYIAHINFVQVSHDVIKDALY